MKLQNIGSTLAIVGGTASLVMGGHARPLTGIGAPAVQDPSETLEVRVEAVVARALEDDRMSGVSVAVAVGSDTLLDEGWGSSPEGASVDAETLYGAGGFMDLWIRVAALSLVEDGELELAEPITERFEALGEDYAQVTVEHLLAHTSGLADFTERLADDLVGEADLEREALLAALADAPLESTPGDCFTYSRTNTLLLGWLVEDATEASLQSAIAGRVFEPAGMDCAGFGGDAASQSAASCQEIGGHAVWGPGGVQPFGGHRALACANDMLAFQRALLDRELLGEALTRRLLTSVRLPDGDETGYGWGVNLGAIGDLPGASFGGGSGGYRVHVAHYPSFDLTVVLLAVGEEAPVASLERSIVRSVFDLPEPDNGTRPLPAEEREAYVGSFNIGCNRVEITFEQDHLVFSSVDYPRYELHYQGRHRFVAESDSDIHVTFEVENGVASSFTLDEHGRQVVGVRFE